MRLKSATLHGLWGVYSASGKKEIHIDFTKCMHNIILIVGKNGSGKTTIWEALQPIPLPSSKFIDKEPGFIHLEYFYEDLIYKIRIEYPITNSRDRAQTKAFISRISDNDSVELNPNGNINSYKSILYSEFNLDPSFVSLSQISQEDMGIVNKKPSERKKYVSSITDNIEVYNDIYKSLVKRSSIFRSMINSITAKMDTIGNQENLVTNLTAKEVLLDRLVTERDFLTRRKIELEKDIATIDPDKKIQEQFQQLTTQILEAKKKIADMEVFIKSIKNRHGTNDPEELKEKVSKLGEKIIRAEVKVREFEDQIRKMHEQKNSLMVKIVEKSEKIKAMRSEYNYEQLKEEIQHTFTSIRECKNLMKMMGFSDASSIITKDEFVTGVNILSVVKDKINLVKGDASNEKVLRFALDSCNRVSATEAEINDLRVSLETVSNLMLVTTQKIEDYKKYKVIADKLDHRPSKCTIDKCFFIEDAVEASAKISKSDLLESERLLRTYKAEKDEYTKDLEFLVEQLRLEHEINGIIEYIQSNSSILSKFPTCGALLNLETFLEGFCNSLFIDKLSELVNSMNQANVFENYKSLSSRLADLERDEKIYADKEKIVALIENDIQELDKESNDLVLAIDRVNTQLLTYKNMLESSKSEKKDLENAVSITTRYREESNSLNILDAGVSQIANNIKAIEEYVNGINEINSRLSAIESDMKPISAEKEQLRFSLKQLEEYKSELSLYTEKYNTVEIIKKYSSPTKGGIQTLFMQLYMGKTISMTNELLATLFDGRMELEPYIINDTEFRIPCINKESNVYHDDISSCSSAERAMISMMIGFSLLYHSSTMYNILRMDEIDGALDQDNRSSFIGLLNSFMNKFGIEQCIMISHSSEINMGEADVIQLIPVAGAQNSGNIIFTYE